MCLFHCMWSLEGAVCRYLRRWLEAGKLDDPGVTSQHQCQLSRRVAQFLLPQNQSKPPLQKRTILQLSLNLWPKVCRPVSPNQPQALRLHWLLLTEMVSWNSWVARTTMTMTMMMTRRRIAGKLKSSVEYNLCLLTGRSICHWLHGSL